MIQPEREIPSESLKGCATTGAAMATGKITISSLRDLRGWLWDTSVVGFGARRQTNGVFYYLRYRHNGTQIMKSIGRHGSPWTPDAARNEAKRLLGTLAGGDDPFTQSLSAEGFGAEVERYLERKRAALKPRSFEEVNRFLTNHSAPLHRLRLTEIDRRTIAVLLAEIERTKGPVAATEHVVLLVPSSPGPSPKDCLRSTQCRAQPRPTRTEVVNVS
jgi:uncharacterized small protein (DUF1192 family)